MPFGVYSLKPCRKCGGDRPHNNKGQCMACRQRVKREAAALQQTKPRRRLKSPTKGVAVSRRREAAKVLPLAHAIVDRRANGRCEVCATATPPNKAERHHRLPRGAGGTTVVAVNSAGNLLYLCKACHRFLENNRALAYARGRLLKHPAVPTERPVALCLHGWVLLGDDGSITPCDPPGEVTA